MSKLFIPYQDGWLGLEGIRRTVVSSPRFPFKTNPIRADIWTREFDWDWEVPPRGYLPRTGYRTAWTNLVTQSEDFTSAAWTKTNATATANVGTAPDGNTTLGKLLETTATGEHSVSQAATATAVASEASVFAQGGLTRRLLRLAFVDSAATTFSAYFDLESGTVFSLSAGATAVMIALGNSQYQCVLRFTPAAGAGTFKVNIATAPGTISYAGNASLGVYLWGAQVSAGTSAPYVSTTSATRSVLAPDRDPLDPLALLIYETDLSVVNSQSGRVRRTFSRIPIQQTEAGTRWVKKPDLPGVFPQDNGTAIIVKPKSDIPQWFFYTRKVVTADSGAPTAGFAGGAFTITYSGQTTAALAYNAGATAVQAAINALTNIPDGVVVTGPVGGPFVVAFNGKVPALAVNVGGITTSGGTAVGTPRIDSSIYGQFNFSITASPFGAGAPNGGTFTLTLFGQTTAPIAYNATRATVAAAINALSNVAAHGGVFCSWGGGPLGTDSIKRAGEDYCYCNVMFNGYALMTSDGTGLIPSGSSATVTDYGGFFGSTPATHLRNIQTVTLVPGSPPTQRTLTSAANGFSITDSLVVKIGSSFYTLSPGSFTLPDANTIVITSGAPEAFNASGTASIAGNSDGSVYSADSVQTETLTITSYYLIGFTPGIASIGDIPKPPYQGDPASILQAIFSGATTLNIDVGDRQPYKDGPIIERTYTTINPSTL